MELSKENIIKVLKKAAEHSNIFTSEEDFKFQFAISFKSFFPNSKFIFDYQIDIGETGGTKNNQRKKKTSYIDAIVSQENNLYPIEFKYKTKGVDITDYIGSFKTLGNYNLKSQSANDWGHYGGMKDIWRLEQLLYSQKGNTNIKRGYVIFLTNDSHYYKDDICDNFKETSNFYPFRIGNRRKLIKGEPYSWKKHSKSFEQLQSPLIFHFDYEFNWESFYNSETDVFKGYKYLLVEVRKP